MEAREIFEVVLEYLGVVAWPIVALVFCFLFRKPLAAVLGGKLTVGHGDSKMVFESLQKQQEKDDHAVANLADRLKEKADDLPGTTTAGANAGEQRRKAVEFLRGALDLVSDRWARRVLSYVEDHDPTHEKYIVIGLTKVLTIEGTANNVRQDPVVVRIGAEQIEKSICRLVDAKILSRDENGIISIGEADS